MKNKIPIIFNICCIANIIAVLIFFGVMFFNFFISQAVQYPGDLFSYSLIIISIITIYAANCYLSLKLVTRYFDSTTIINTRQPARIIFYILEFILLIFYSYLFYEIIADFHLAEFWPLNTKNTSKLMAFLAFLTGYFSSLFRINFTWPLYKIIRDRNALVVNTFGEK